ncbi:membrane fusogenic activity family protein [Nocardiopsis algeriensis]|uniref:membrane fusogenic activity family protein n=1 Tax=Nocardiopsis algeriensis TaxID=1478215 RepID=UPI003B42B346
MVVDAVRTYLDAANGLTELSRKQAVAAAKTLLRAGGAVPAPGAEGDAEGLPPRVGQSIQALAGELIETSQANRAALAELVRAEVERRLEQMDVVPRPEYERLVRRVAELERRMVTRLAERAPAPVAEPAPAVPSAASAPEPAAAEPAPVPVAEPPGDEAAEASSAPEETPAPEAGDTPAAPKSAARSGTKATTRTTRARTTAKRTTKGTTKSRGSTKK